MFNEKIIKKYLPLTHTTYYILISLTTPLHGYGIMQKVEELSEGEINLGPGTLYGALSKLEKDGLIKKLSEEANERRKSYLLTDLGREIIKLEFKRLKVLVARTQHFFE
jgi:DNA-binding PadR family transcriptional regulator